MADSSTDFWAAQAAGAIQGLATAVGTKGQQKRQYKYNRQLMEYSAELSDQAAAKAYERQKDFYNIQNEYNDPSNVVQRYRDADVNPYAAFGTAGSYTPAQQTPSAPQGSAPGSSVSMAPVSAFAPLDYMLKAAQIDNIRADTAKKQGETLDPEETRRGQILTNSLTAAKVLNTESATELNNLDKQFQSEVFDTKVATEQAKLNNIAKQYDLLSQQIAESASKSALNEQSARESVSRILLNEVNASLTRTQNDWYGRLTQAQIDQIYKEIDKATSEISLNDSQKFLNSSREWTEDVRRRGIQLDNMFKSIDLGIGKDGKVDNAAIFVRQADNILKILKGWL